MMCTVHNDNSFLFNNTGLIEILDIICDNVGSKFRMFAAELGEDVPHDDQITSKQVTRMQ